MPDKIVDSRELVRGAARWKDLLYVLSKGKVLMGQGIAHSSVVALYQGKWVDGVNTTWDSTAIAVARAPSEKMILVGEDGDVAAYVGGKTTSETITPTPTAIRNAKTIDGLVYACGMKRQVFKRVGEKKWKDISAPMAKTKKAFGFEAIDGYSDKEIYAAGWNGELWQFDGSAWTERGTATNVTLTAVCCSPDGLVYVAGQDGTLLKGRNATWEIVDLGDDVDVDFWDLCWFKDQLYVATITGLFTLKGDELIDVDFGKNRPVSFYSLSTADGILWSVGRDDVASFDGTRWKIYD